MGPKNNAMVPLSRAQIIGGMINKHLRLLKD
jgi:hypothetical protein